MLRFIFISLLAAGAFSQMVKQCPCGAYNACLATAQNVLVMCTDKCQSHFTSLGANFGMARQCILAHQGQLNGAFNCAKNRFGQVCGDAMVPKRYPETVQIAAFREITAGLQRSGLASEATALLQVARKSVGCVLRCVQQQSCVSRMSCGLALPSDNIIVQTVKSCAINSGFLTNNGLKSICTCLSAAGMRQLGPICPKINLQL